MENLRRASIDGREVCLRIGVDLGGNDIKFGATNLDADKVLLPDLIKRPSLTREGPERTIEQTLSGIRAVLEELGADWREVSDVAVTVPCPCSREGAIIEATNIGTPETKEEWQVPFGDLLAARVKEVSSLRIPVFACNDANAAAQDDDFVRFGLDSGKRTNIFITTGTGLGGGVIVDGHVFFGLGQAGELGHVKPAIPDRYRERFGSDRAPFCGCGAVDCAETRASLSGLLRRIGWALSDPGLEFIRRDVESRGGKVEEETVRTLRELARQDVRKAAYQVRTFADQEDLFCRWLLEDWAILIGALFASIAPVVHPDLFIIGGGLTEMSKGSRDWFIDRVRQVYSEVNGQSCFDTSPGNCEIVWSVSEDQGWRGAILMAMRSREND